MNNQELKCMYCENPLSNITKSISFDSDNKYDFIHVECKCQFCGEKQYINIINGKGNINITLTENKDTSY